MRINRINTTIFHKTHFFVANKENVNFAGIKNNDTYQKNNNSTQNLTLDYLKKHLVNNLVSQDRLFFDSYKNKQISNEELLYLIDNFADKLSFVDFKLFAQNSSRYNILS